MEVACKLSLWGLAPNVYLVMYVADLIAVHTNMNVEVDASLQKAAAKQRIVDMSDRRQGEETFLMWGGVASYLDKGNFPHPNLRIGLADRRVKERRDGPRKLSPTDVTTGQSQRDHRSGTDRRERINNVRE